MSRQFGVRECIRKWPAILPASESLIASDLSPKPLVSVVVHHPPSIVAVSNIALSPPLLGDLPVCPFELAEQSHIAIEFSVLQCSTDGGVQ